MKRLKRWLLVLGTLLLTGVGAAMPWAAARFQDRYGVAGQEVLPFDPVSLTLRKDSEIGTILRLMSQPYELSDWDGETQMTEDSARMAAFDLLVQLDQYGLLEPCFDGYGDAAPNILDRMKAEQMCDVWPMLHTALDGSSTVLWICWWTDPAGPQYHMLVDDATGLAVNGYIPCASDADMETLYQRMQRWSDFFESYYGITVQGVQDTIYDAAAEFIYSFDLEDGLGPCGLAVYCYEFEMDFSICAVENASLLPSAAVYGWEAEDRTAFTLSID